MWQVSIEFPSPNDIFNFVSTTHVESSPFIFKAILFEPSTMKITVLKEGLDPETTELTFDEFWTAYINAPPDVGVALITRNIGGDNEPPDTVILSTIDGSGASVTNGGSTLSDSIDITFTGTDDVAVASFECSLDGAAFSSCSSPIGFASLALTSHTFEVRAIDTAANVDPTPASFTWSVLTPAQALENACNDIADTINNTTDPDLKDELEDALQSCQTALTELNKTPPDNQEAAEDIEDAVGSLEDAIEDNGLDTTQGENLINQLLNVLRQLATNAIDVAKITPGSDAEDISSANAALANGDSLRTPPTSFGDFEEAAAEYEAAIGEAEGALP